MGHIKTFGLPIAIAAALFLVGCSGGKGLLRTENAALQREVAEALALVDDARAEADRIRAAAETAQVAAEADAEANAAANAEIIRLIAAEDAARLAAQSARMYAEMVRSNAEANIQRMRDEAAMLVAQAKMDADAAIETARLDAQAAVDVAEMRARDAEAALDALLKEQMVADDTDPVTFGGGGDTSGGITSTATGEGEPGGEVVLVPVYATIDFGEYGDWLEAEFSGVRFIVDDRSGFISFASPEWTANDPATFRGATYIGRVAGYDISSGAYRTGGFSMTFDESLGFTYSFSGGLELLDGGGAAGHHGSLNGWTLQGAHYDGDDISTGNILEGSLKSQSIQGGLYGDGGVAIGTVVSSQNGTDWGFNGMWRGDK